jgi:hypothetical protein
VQVEDDGGTAGGGGGFPSRVSCDDFCEIRHERWGCTLDSCDPLCSDEVKAKLAAKPGCEDIVEEF